MSEIKMDVKDCWEEEEEEIERIKGSTEEVNGCEFEQST